MLLKIITLILMTVFYGCYFVKMLSQRKRGIKTDQLGKGKTGVIKFIEIALKITTYLLLIIQIINIILYKGTAHIALRIAGIILTAIGVGVFIVSVVQMKDSWRAGVSEKEKTTLVTNGIYSSAVILRFWALTLCMSGFYIPFSVGIFALPQPLHW